MRCTLRALHTRRPGALPTADLGLRSILDLNLRSILALAAHAALFPKIGCALASRSLGSPGLRFRVSPCTQTCSVRRRRARLSPNPRPPVFLFRRIRCGQIGRCWTIWLEAPGTGSGVGRSVHACSLV